MLLTLQYNPEAVEILISKIENSSKELNDLLSSCDDFSSIINKLLDILNNRDIYFEEFQNLLNEENLGVYFRNNHNKWLSRIKKIMELEKINLDIIEKNMILQSDKVKDLNRQKQLLLYLKRQV